MWLWESELHELGFRRRGDRYWQCRQRFGLGEDEHISVFSWSEQALPTQRRRRPRFLIDLSEFHVTFQRGGEHLHFYYHERLENEWQPAGHTSPREILRVGQDPTALRQRADTIAATLVAALAGVYHPRSKG